jgi:hypothetical protein
MNDDDINYLVFILLIACATFCILSYGFGYSNAESRTQKDFAILTIKALNNVKKQLPKDTKLTNPFTDEDLKPLNYDTQKILKLF